MANESDQEPIIDGLSSFFVSMLYFFECLGNYIAAFFHGLLDVVKNTLEEDVTWPDVEGTKDRYSESFTHYQKQLEPYFESILDQFPFVIAFSSFVVPLVLICVFVTYCCSSTSEDSLDDVDAGPLQGTLSHQAYQFEGKRWFRQAECDFNAAYNDLGQREQAPEWTCIKCQQVE